VFLVSSTAASWWLGAAAAVAGFVLVEAFVVGPASLGVLAAGGIGPGTYYLAHHLDALDDESQPWDVTSVWPFLVFYVIPEDSNWVAIGVAVLSFAGVGIAVATMARLDGRAYLDRDRENPGDDDDPTARARALAVRQDPLRRWTTQSWPARRARIAWTWLASTVRSNQTVARCLGLIVSVVGFLAVGELPDVPGIVPWLVLLSLGQFAYYRMHYGRLTVDVPFGRRALRMLAVVVPTLGVAGDETSLLSVAVTAVTCGLLLKSVTLAEQSPMLAERDTPGDDGDPSGGDEERRPPWRRATWTENR
jgi:hypothetical protein